MSDGPRIDISLPVRRADVEWVGIDGEAVLHDPVAEVVHHLNPTATTVWEACDGSRSVAAIVRQLRRTYPGAGDQLAGDVRGLIETLRRLDLIAEARQQA